MLPLCVYSAGLVTVGVEARMGGEDEGGDHTEVEGEGEREDSLDRVQLQHRHTLVVRQGHLYKSP